MEEEEKKKEILFNKAISFFNENFYSMALYYFGPSKTLNNEEIVVDYIKKCHEKIKERENENKSKQFLNIKERQEEKANILRIIESNNHYEILGLRQNAKRDEIIEAYKKLIIKYHPDINTSERTEEVFKKISKSYNRLINGSNNEPNPYHLMEEVFKDEDILELMNNEKGNLELKQFSIPPIAKGISSFIQLGILFYVVVYFVLPYFSTETESELYGFNRSVTVPFEKTSKRFKIKYYVGNDFKEKYVSHKDVRKIEKEIEANYLEYLNKTCKETNETKQKFQKRLIYYKKGSLNYNTILEDISKVDLSICDELIKYSKRYHSFIDKMEKKEKELEKENEKESENEEENDSK